MNSKKLTNPELSKVSGGNMETDEHGNKVFKNICTECGEAWEYVLEKDATAMPNWATGPWCPKCREKHREEFSKKHSSKQ